MRAWWWLATLGLLLVPCAPAQMTIDVTGPDAPLQPELQIAQVDVTATIDCDALLVRSLGQASGELHVVVDAGNEAVFVTVGATRAAVDTEPCRSVPPAASVTVQLPMGVLVTRDLPATTPVTVTVRGEVAGQGPVGSLFDPLQASAGFDVSAAPYFLMHASVAEPIKTTAGGPVSFEAHIRNLGNSPIVVHTTLLEASEGTHEWLREVEPVAVDRAAEAIVTVVFDVPEGSGFVTNEQALFRLAFTSWFEGEEGAPFSTNLLIRVHGGAYETIPGPGPLPLLALLGAAALLARRRPGLRRP